MQAVSSRVFDRNRVYGLSNTTTKNLRVARSVLTVESSQLVLSTHSQEFVALQLYTTHLTEKYEQLLVDYEQLHQMVMDMRS
jgi:hypothetical protein